MFSRVFTALLGALGAGAAAQFPAFYTQYLQHLAGRLMQVESDLTVLQQQAADEGLSPEAYLSAAEAEGGRLTGGLVEGYRTILDSAQELRAAYEALQSAGPLERPFVFAAHAETASTQVVWQNFVPAMPVSAEGLAYGLSGVLLGVIAAWCCERPLVFARRGGKRRKAEGQPLPADRRPAGPAQQRPGLRHPGLRVEPKAGLVASTGRASAPMPREPQLATSPQEQTRPSTPLRREIGAAAKEPASDAAPKEPHLRLATNRERDSQEPRLDFARAGKDGSVETSEPRLELRPARKTEVERGGLRKSDSPHEIRRAGPVLRATTRTEPKL